MLDKKGRFFVLWVFGDKKVKLVFKKMFLVVLCGIFIVNFLLFFFCIIMILRVVYFFMENV